MTWQIVNDGRRVLDDGYRNARQGRLERALEQLSKGDIASENTRKPEAPVELAVHLLQERCEHFNKHSSNAIDFGDIST